MSINYSQHTAPYLQVLEEADKKFFKKDPKTAPATAGNVQKGLNPFNKGLIKGTGAEAAVKAAGLKSVEAPVKYSPASSGSGTPSTLNKEGKKKNSKVVTEGDKRNSMNNQNRPKSSFEDLYNSTISEGLGDDPEHSQNPGEEDLGELSLDSEDGIGLDGEDNQDELGGEGEQPALKDRIKNCLDELQAIYTELGGDEGDESSPEDEDGGDLGGPEDLDQQEDEHQFGDEQPVGESKQYDGKLKPAVKNAGSKFKQNPKGFVKVTAGKGSSSGLGKKYDGKFSKAPSGDALRKGKSLNVPIAVGA